MWLQLETRSSWVFLFPLPVSKAARSSSVTCDHSLPPWPLGGCQARLGSWLPAGSGCRRAWVRVRGGTAASGRGRAHPRARDLLGPRALRPSLDHLSFLVLLFEKFLLSKVELWRRVHLETSHRMSGGRQAPSWRPYADHSAYREQNVFAFYTVETLGFRCLRANK